MSQEMDFKCLLLGNICIKVAILPNVKRLQCVCAQFSDVKTMLGRYSVYNGTELTLFWNEHPPPKR